MATRAQLLATEQANALAALNTSVASGMSNLKAGLASDPLTAIPTGSLAVINLAMDTITALAAAKEMIYIMTASDGTYNRVA